MQQFLARFLAVLMVSTLGASAAFAAAAKVDCEMTFTMSASTAREGTMRAGSPVSVRYRQDGPTYLATAITVRPTTQQASNKSSAH